MFLYHAWPWDVNLMVPPTPSAVLVKKKSATWSREDEVLRGSADRLLTANALCSSAVLGRGKRECQVASIAWRNDPQNRQRWVFWDEA